MARWRAAVDLFRQNWGPGYGFSDGQEWDFSGVFGVFFPAVIGIFAGANISENLKVLPPAELAPHGNRCTVKPYIIMIMSRDLEFTDDWED